MATTDDVKRVLGMSRNGANEFIRYSPLFPRFIVSDGVKELADAAGCYWLLDLLASELAPQVLGSINTEELTHVFVEFAVENNVGKLTVTSRDDAPPYWFRKVEFTDFPAGKWSLFEIAGLEWDEQSCKALNLACILLSEH